MGTPTVITPSKPAFGVRLAVHRVGSLESCTRLLIVPFATLTSAAAKPTGASLNTKLTVPSALIVTVTLGAKVSTVVLSLLPRPRLPAVSV